MKKGGKYPGREGNGRHQRNSLGPGFVLGGDMCVTPFKVSQNPQTAKLDEEGGKNSDVQAGVLSP